MTGIGEMVMKQSDQFVCSKYFRDLIIKFPSEGIKNCCKTTDNNHIPITDITNDYLSSNNIYLSGQKSMLFDNVLPAPTCNTCIQSEPNSLFRIWNQFDTLDSTEKNSLYGSDNFTSYEFMLSSACDLKCVYCAPKDSSAWAKELGVPVYDSSAEWREHVTNTLFSHLENRSWDDSETHWFYFSGGEPTYNLDTIGFIEEVMKRVPDNIDARVIVNSNLNTKPVVLEKFLKYVKNNPSTKIGISASIDSLGEKCEAIRYGINWDRAISNLKRYFEFDHVQVFLSPTVNLMSVPDMLEYIVYFRELYASYGKEFHINENMVAEPWLSPTSMLPEHKILLDHAIDYCKRHDISYVDHLRKLRELIGTDNTADTREHVKRHLEYLELHRPNTNWRGLFPHIEDIINGHT